VELSSARRLALFLTAGTKPGGCRVAAMEGAATRVCCWAGFPSVWDVKVMRPIKFW